MPNLPSKNQTKQTLNKRIECGVSFDWMAKKKHSQWVNIVKLHRRNNCWHSKIQRESESEIHRLHCDSRRTVQFFHTKWRTITRYECNILGKMRWASGESKSESEKGQKRNKSLIDVWRCACDGAWNYTYFKPKKSQRKRKKERICGAHTE